MNVGRKIFTYGKAIGLAAVVSLASCGKKEIATDCANSIKKPPVKTSSIGKLISMLERGDRHSARLVNTPEGAKVITAEEAWKYTPNDTLGQLYYKVYAGKADKAIRKARGQKGTLVTVGHGVARKEYIQLANGQKAYEGDFISAAMADSLVNRAISQKDSILRANIAASAYSKMKSNEKDAVISYLYNVSEKILKKTSKGKSFFQHLSEGNIGFVQSKFNVVPSAQCARAGLAKRNLIHMLVFGDGKILENKAAQENFVKQVKEISKHKKGKDLLNECFDIAEKYGVNKSNLEETKIKVDTIL